MRPIRFLAASLLALIPAAASLAQETVDKYVVLTMGKPTGEQTVTRKGPEYTATFSYNVTDSGGTANGGVDTLPQTLTITVTAVNTPPVLGTSGGTTGFVEGANVTSPPVAIDPAITVSDVDNLTLATATVTIGTGRVSAEDVLGFTNINALTMGNIVLTSFNAATGVLTLTSAGNTATVDQWRAALASVTYTNTSQTPVATRSESSVPSRTCITSSKRVPARC